jgi:SAM-dependent methyltransferase
MKRAEEVQRDFDRIALASAERPDIRGLYDEFLLEQVPTDCERALEIGCGTGCFTRLLAARVKRVSAVDLSSEMLRVARARTAATNVDYRLCDVMKAAHALGTFGCVVCLSAFHHLPQDEGARALKALTVSGGTLILHDLWRVESAADRALDAVRLPVKALRLLHERQPLWYGHAERAAWREHALGDRHLTPGEVVTLRDRHFPGAAIHKHFLWRYTLVWRAPNSQPSSSNSSSIGGSARVGGRRASR